MNIGGAHQKVTGNLDNNDFLGLVEMKISVEAGTEETQGEEMEVMNRDIFREVCCEGK